MPAPSVVHPAVWASLDPYAGRLSRRARNGVIAFVGGVAVLLAAAIWLVVSGHGLPRLQADYEVARAVPASHDVLLHLSFNNDGASTQRVTGFTVKSAVFVVIDSRPAAFTVRPNGSNTRVSVRVHVRNCAAVTRDTIIPLAVVSKHWFGHYNNTLFSSSGDQGITGVAWNACHGG